MKKIISTLLASCCLTSLIAQEVVVKGPDENCNWLYLLLQPKSQVIRLPTMERQCWRNLLWV